MLLRQPLQAPCLGMNELTLQLRQAGSLDVRGHHARVVLVVWLHAQHGSGLPLSPTVLGPRHREA
eukprot:11175650-Lingulodinium_polyedra.AAC.1